MGRPTRYTEELAAEICRRLGDGESLRAICESEPEFPAESTVRLWHIDDRQGFAAQYTRAREAQYLKWADEIVDIADDGSNDYQERLNKDDSTYMAFDGEHVQRSRLRVDSRKWMLSKMLPKIYGDKLNLEHEGGVTVERITRTIVKPGHTDS